MRGAGVMFFAYIGFDAVWTAAQEAKNPQRDMPIGILGSLAICTVIYILVAIVLLGIVPYRELNVADPLAVGIDATGIRWLSPVIKVAALFGLFSTMLVNLMAQTRIFYSMSRDGLLPAVFATVHPRFRTPYLAIVAYAAIVATLAISSSFTQLAILANVGSLSLYLLCVIASYELQGREVRGSGTPFTTPGGPLVPILAAGAIVWLLSQATWKEFAIEAIVLVAASGLYVTVGRRPFRR